MARRQQASGAIDEPNFIVPLAFSYNERGIAGYTHAVTNSEDQRKINCMYEIVKNSATGKGTLTLSKRPGVTLNTNTSGSSTQSVYLALAPVQLPMQNNSDLGTRVFNTVPNGGNTDVREGTNVVLSSATAVAPVYVDRTFISTVQNEVLQIRNSFTAPQTQRVYFAVLAGVYTEITDVDFTSIQHQGKMEHMDGFAFILGYDNKIWNSDSNSLANWSATSFLAKQSTADGPVGLARFKNQLLAFGERTVEVFYNAGNTVGSPLLPIKNLTDRVGMIAPPYSLFGGHYYCYAEGMMFYVGRAGGGMFSAALYAYDGQSHTKVSPSYIDKILTEVSTTSYYSMNTFPIMGRTAVAILLTSPNATSQRWLMFFPEWKEWFEWTSTVFSPINDGQYFISCGSSLKDKLYRFVPSDNWQDDGTSFPASTQFKIPTNGSSTKFLPMYGVDADTDNSGIANTLTMEISTSDPQTFSTLGTIDLSQDRKVAFEGGSFTKAWMRIGNTNSRPFRIHNFLARIE